MKLAEIFNLQVLLSGSAVTYNDKNNEVGDSKMIGTICILHVNDRLEKNKIHHQELERRP